MNTTDSRKYEWLIYCTLWVLVLVAPIVSNMLGANYEGLRWEAIIRSWIITVPFIIMFLIHDLLLIPLLFLKHRLKSYILAVVVLLSVFGVYQYSTPGHTRPPGARFNLHDTEFESRREKMARTKCIDERKPEKNGPVEKGPGKDGNPFFGPGSLLMHEPKILNLILAFLMLGLNMAIVLLFKYQQEREHNKDLENMQLQHELEYLKAQINPHFFMNMLNNIHAMIDVNPPKAQDMVLELSKLMRYVLYEGACMRTSLQKEVSFIANYIGLMRKRYSEKKVNIVASLPDNPSESVMIPPLLFIVFIENAFKHGISYRKPSFIDISLEVNDEKIIFKCENSIARSTSANKEPGGVGLENIRKRLRLIYGENYDLNTEELEDKYSVTLEIPIL